LAAALTVLLAASAVANVTALVLPGAKLAAALLLVPLIPVFLVWFFRARKNADGRGQTQRWGPGWSIGAWFTPFVNYVFPFQVMADIWRANLPGERRQQTAWLLGAWWACWLAGFGVVDIVRWWPRPTSGPDVVLHIAGGLLTAAAAALLIVIVRAVTHGPVGREPVAAQPGSVPQAWPTAAGAAYPGPAWGAGDGRRTGVSAGYALSGLAVAAVTAVAAALYWLPSAATPATAPRPTPTPTSSSTPGARYLTVDQLRAGNCLQGPPDVNTSSTWPDLVTAVPCTKEHLAEVFFAGNYWRAGSAFPGNAVIYHQAQVECRKAFHVYDGIAYSSSSYAYGYVSPQGRPDWNSGDRLLLCVAYLWTNQHPGGEPLYASIKGSDS
jgi:hypothetical protein